MGELANKTLERSKRETIERVFVPEEAFWGTA